MASISYRIKKKQTSFSIPDNFLELYCQKHNCLLSDARSEFRQVAQSIPDSMTTHQSRNDLTVLEFYERLFNTSYSSACKENGSFNVSIKTKVKESTTVSLPLPLRNALLMHSGGNQTKVNRAVEKLHHIEFPSGISELTKAESDSGYRQIKTWLCEFVM